MNNNIVLARLFYEEELSKYNSGSLSDKVYNLFQEYANKVSYKGKDQEEYNKKLTNLVSAFF